MRITGGTHRSRKLETPKSDAVRPTSDKVRQAIFNMLHSRGVVHDAIIIDAFCGTGALGLEALSQGAAHCTFLDKDKKSIALCKANVTALGEDERSNIIFQDSTKMKPCPDNIETASLVFLDPPYQKNLVPMALQSMHENNWLSEDCFFVIETAKNEDIFSDLIQIENEKIYGDTKITLARLNDTTIDQR